MSEIIAAGGVGVVVGFVIGVVAMIVWAVIALTAEGRR